MGNSPGSHANNIYSCGSDKFTEVQSYILTSRQLAEPSLTLKSLFYLLFSDLAVKAAKSENKKGFSTSEKVWIRGREISSTDMAAGGIATSFCLKICEQLLLYSKISVLMKQIQ